jgi:Tfp pilus assembly protein PilF
VSKHLAIITFVFIGSVAGQVMNYSPPLSSDFNSMGGQSVQGEIRNLRGATDLMVVVNAVTSARPVQQAPVESNGLFQLRAVPPGIYVVRVVRLPNEIVLEQTVQLGENSPFLTLQLPESPLPNGAATVSADRLQHPLTKKGARMIRAAQAYAESGDHSKAIEELKHALNEPSAVPYAHSILGTEYLKTREPVLARREIELALQILPHDPALHSNLGYALWMTGDPEKGEREVRKALDLDHNNATAQRLLGYILKSCGEVRTCGVQPRPVEDSK